MPNRRPAPGDTRKTTRLMSSIRERNKELILRAASEEFADKGFAATKTSDIAAKAGLPKPNVYYYFKSKENLYREVLESIIDPLLAASAPFNQPGLPADVLKAYIRSKIRISRELPYASKVFASEIMHGAPHLSAEQTDGPGRPTSLDVQHLGRDPDLCRLRLANIHRNRQSQSR